MQTRNFSCSALQGINTEEEWNELNNQRGWQNHYRCCTTCQRFVRKIKEGRRLGKSGSRYEDRNPPYRYEAGCGEDGSLQKYRSPYRPFQTKDGYRVGDGDKVYDSHGNKLDISVSGVAYSGWRRIPLDQCFAQRRRGGW